MVKVTFVLVIAVMFVCSSAFGMCGMCGSDSGHKHESSAGTKSVFSQVAEEAAVKGGVKKITYSQFMSIRNSGEKYALMDVLSPNSYKEGHIEGAASFPLDTINKAAAKHKLSKDDNIINHVKQDVEKHQSLRLQHV